MAVRMVPVTEILSSWGSVDGDCYCGAERYKIDHVPGCGGCSSPGCCCWCPYESLMQVGTCGWCSEDIESAWADLLLMKRMDPHYPDVVRSLKEEGFVRSLTCIDNGDGSWIHGDGHHRLAAAIELGYMELPYEVADGENLISWDSGTWSYGEPIAGRVA